MPLAPRPAPRTVPASPPVVATPLPPPAPGAAPVADPQGLSEDEVTRLLGAPDRSEVEGPSHVWTYAAASCTLRLTFFLDVNRNAYFALDRRFIGTDGGAAAAQACLQRIAARVR